MSNIINFFRKATTFDRGERLFNRRELIRPDQPFKSHCQSLGKNGGLIWRKFKKNRIVMKMPNIDKLFFCFV